MTSSLIWKFLKNKQCYKRCYRFDFYRERSILSGNERKIIAVFFVVFLLTANQKMSIFANIANSKIIVDLLTGMKSYNAAGVKGCKFL